MIQVADHWAPLLVSHALCEFKHGIIPSLHSQVHVHADVSSGFTLEESSETVLAMTAPQPSSKAFFMTA